MSRSPINAKGRRESGAFVALPFGVICSDNFKKLTAKGNKLFVDLCSQLRMKQGGAINNGDLCITPKVMRARGWTSRETLYYARDELLHYGFIQVTRPGGFYNLPNLYALSFLAINECNGKLDVAETNIPSNTWKESKSKWKRPKRNKKKSPYRFSCSVVSFSVISGGRNA